MKKSETNHVIKSVGYGVARKIYWDYLIDLVGIGAEAIVSDRVLDTESFRRYCRPDRVFPLADDISGLDSEWLEKIQPCIPSSIHAFDTTPWEFSEPFVAGVENVTLVGPHSVAVTDDKKVIADTLTFESSKRVKYALSEAVLSHPIKTLRTLHTGKPANNANSIDRAILLNGGWNNYYHWIVEHLAKLRGLEQYEKKTGSTAKIILPEDPASYMTQSLEMAGISSEDWITWPGDQMVVNELVVPSYPELTPGVLKWLQESILSSELMDTTSPKRVFVSRQKAKKRRIRNCNSFKSMLEEHGFVTKFMEELSFEDQVRLVYNADVIVSPHGAGLTNIIWGSDLTVFELFPNCIKSPYYVLSEILGHTYKEVICDDVGDANKQINKDMIVNPSKFENQIEQYLS